MNLFTPLTLPNGAVIPNRIAKAAMEENMADADHAPSDALLQLYNAWAEGGCGLILTGNSYRGIGLNDCVAAAQRASDEALMIM